jgi:predicted MFS family arabinose efflux permease
VRAVLKGFPDTLGYGILHLLAFGFFSASYIAFACIKEPLPAPRPPKLVPTLRENLRRVPGLFRASPAFGWIVASRFFRAGMLIGMPFLSIYVLGKLSLKQDFIGYLIICQMVGSVVGNVIAGSWGDRSGSRPATLLALLLFLPLAIYIPFAASAPSFYLIFAGFGFCFSATDVGLQALMLEICPDHDRTLYLSLGQFLTVPSMIIASLLGSWLWTRTGSMTALMIATVISVAISAGLLVRMERYRILFRHVLRLAPLIRREG